MSDGDAASSGPVEKRNEASPPPPVSRGPAPKHSCGFLDPRLGPLRKILLQATGGGTLLSVIAIFGILGLYWGALFSINDEISGLTGFVIDLDGGKIGQAVSSAFLDLSASPGQLTWVGRSYDDVTLVAEAVRENQCWVAVVANAGASANLTLALSNPSIAYEGQNAVTVYTNQARNQQAFPFIQSAYLPVLTSLASNFAVQQARNLSSSDSGSSLANLLSQNPSVVTQPVYYTVDNLIPFDVPAAIATTFVGLIYVTIFAFTLTMQGFNGRQPIQPYLNLQSLLVLRITLPLFGYLLLSLAYTALQSAFQIPLNRKFGSAGFVVFWMLCWVAMLALGFALEFAITILTPRFVSYFLLLWIVAQVAVSLYPIDMLPNVYRYGYAAPFANFSEGARTIIFGTKNKVGQNFGILIGWTVISICTTSLVTVWQYRREEKALRAADSKRIV